MGPFSFSSRRRLFLLGFLVLGAACTPAPGPIPVQLLGYRAYLADGTRLYDEERPPILGLPVDAPPVEVRLGGTRLAVKTEARGPWRLLRVQPGVEAQPERRRLSMHVGRHHVGGWTVVWDRTPKKLLAEAVAARAKKDLSGAEAALERATGLAALWVPVERARLAREGAGPASRAWEAAAAQTAAIPSEAGRRLRVAAYYATMNFEYARTASLLERATRKDGANPIGQARNLYYQGQLARHLGRWGEATELLGRAATASAQLGEDQDVHSAREMAGLLLSETGRHREALETLRGEEAYLAGATPEDQRRGAVNLAYAELRAALAARAPLGAARAGLRAVLKTLPAGRRAATLSNLTWAAHAEGDAAAARRWLEAARTTPTTDGRGDNVRHFLTVLEGDLELEAGHHPQAKQAYQRARAAATEAFGGASETGWTARFGLGRVAEAGGDLEAARQHYAAARTELDALGRAAAVRRSRAPFFADRRKLPVASLSLLLRMDRPEEAFEVAAQERARVLRGLDVHAQLHGLDADHLRRWSTLLAAWDAAQKRYEDLVETADKPAATETQDQRKAAAKAAGEQRAQAFDAAVAFLDETTGARKTPTVAALQAALKPDEALLLFAHLGEAGWRRFELRKQSLKVGPADANIDFTGLKHLHVVPGGRKEALDLGVDLIDRVSVGYLPHPGFLLRGAAPPGETVILADPALDLPWALRSGKNLSVRLDARLLTGGQVSAQAAREALRSARVLHFAGHGVLREADPWGAHLRLANTATLGLEDLLVMPVRAQLVALSGCKTGVPSVLAREDVIGLPEALLSAGARSVIAATRSIPDEEATLFFESFYAGGGAERPAAALQAASKAMLQQKKSVWNAFRLVGLR